MQLPLVTPPVRAATPTGFGGAASAKPSVSGIAAKLQALDASDIKQRFFSGGPTSLFQILGNLDMRITDINRRSGGSSAACLTQEPVPYTLTPFGDSVTFYAQCYETLANPSSSLPSFFQFGQRDGVVYLYESSGAEVVAARLIPSAGTSLYSIDGGPAVGIDSDAGIAPGQYRVDAWIGVGYDSAARCAGGACMVGSYGAIVLHADESRATFELTVAGLGFGYCGAQLRSNGSSVSAVGSLDMGTTCQPIDSLCVLASDVSTPSTCTALASAITQPLGRRATSGAIGTFGESAFPGVPSNQIVLNGTSNDSLHFGPSAPATGAGAFGAK